MTHMYFSARAEDRIYGHLGRTNLFQLRYGIIMRPSSLGGGRILRRTLSVRLSVCLSVRPVIISVTSRHLANYNDTHVLFGMH